MGLGDWMHFALGGAATQKGRNFLFGDDDSYDQLPTLNKGQLGHLDSLGGQLKQLGRGGYGDAMSILQEYLNPQSDIYQNFEAPYMQQFEQQTIPQLAERFAGMGAMGGGLSSSGFGQALGAAGGNLQTQLAQMKQQYQRQSINDFLGQYNQMNNQYLGTRPFENTYQPGSTGLIGGALNSFAGGAGRMAGGGGFF